MGEPIAASRRDESSAASLEKWLQETLSAEHFIAKTSRQLLDHNVVAGDAQAALLVRLVDERARQHVEALEALISGRGDEASSVRGAVAAGLGTTFGWMERLPNRDLVQVVRDVYTVLNYTAAGYHVLYTRAVLLERPAVADVALHHLREYTPTIRQSSEMLAWAAALDLPPEQWQGVGPMPEVVRTLLESWSSDVA